jgi:chromate reductase, NAD(P)H dehydrogenase (quinone)
MEILPEGLSLENFDVSGFPLFNEDLEAELPTAVKKFKAKIREVDGVLFATPEYNYSISAVLKNAIEWGNRPDNSWQGKPVAIMSASASPRGGARAQLHLRQILVDLDMYPINQPQLLVARSEEKFDDNLRLIDQQSRQTLREMLVALARWGRRLHPIQIEIGEQGAAASPAASSN